MPLTTTLRVSLAPKVTLPVMTGVVSLVVCDTTVGTTGAVVSTMSSVVAAEVTSWALTPRALVTTAVTA